MSLRGWLALFHLSACQEGELQMHCMVVLWGQRPWDELICALEDRARRAPSHACRAPLKTSRIVEAPMHACDSIVLCVRSLVLVCGYGPVTTTVSLTKRGLQSCGSNFQRLDGTIQATCQPLQTLRPWPIPLPGLVDFTVIIHARSLFTSSCIKSHRTGQHCVHMALTSLCLHLLGLSHLACKACI